MPKINIPARNSKKAYYSWYIVTREPINGKFIFVWAPTVVDESTDRKATTPTHPVDRQSNVMDDAILGNVNYSVSVKYNTFLQDREGGYHTADNPTTAAINESTTIDPTTHYELVAGGVGTVTAYPPISTSASMLDFMQQARKGLMDIQGLPVDIYSPKFGYLENFILTGLNDSRALASEARMQLSFTERRVSEAQTTIIDTSAIKQRQKAVQEAARKAKEEEADREFRASQFSVALSIADYADYVPEGYIDSLIDPLRVADNPNPVTLIGPTSAVP